MFIIQTTLAFSAKVAEEDGQKEKPTEEKPTMSQRFIQAITPEKEFLPLKLTWWAAKQTTFAYNKLARVVLWTQR